MFDGVVRLRPALSCSVRLSGFVRRCRALSCSVRLSIVALVIAAAGARPSLARAQTAPAPQSTDNPEARLRAERAKLDALRAERERLVQRRQTLQNTVHDLSEEVDNLNREADMTASVVHSLDAQLDAINAEVASTTSDLVDAQDELTLKRVILQRRLIDIYKRGPLFSLEVLLSANSFGDLIARYKYLHLIALRDRVLVRRVEDLRNQIDRQRGNLVHFQSDMEENRQEKADEERRLRDLQSQQSASLHDAQRNARLTDRRIKQLASDEGRLTNVIASLEAARLRAERASPNAPRAAGVFSTANRLDWPVDGPLLYNFGRVVNPNNTTVRWNGIGIRAAEGAEVHAVAAGKVRVAEPFGTYGLTVIIEHPGGDYSVYGSLEKVTVKKGDVVGKGDIIGYVGSTDPELGPHLHFEMRPEGRPVDPLDILKPQP